MRLDRIVTDSRRSGRRGFCMHRPATLLLRTTIFFTAALTAACTTNGDITRSATERAAFAEQMQEPVPSRELNPPSSSVEIRAQCWMRYEKAEVDLNSKAALVNQCVSDRTRNSAP